jgi:hypothetical protein
MGKTFDSTIWNLDPNLYLRQEDGIILGDEDLRDCEELRKLYPALKSWSNEALLSAWGEYCSDYNLTSWTEPFKSRYFLTYLELAQEDKLPDTSEDAEAIHDFLVSLP